MDIEVLKNKIKEKVEEIGGTYRDSYGMVRISKGYRNTGVYLEEGGPEMKFPIRGMGIMFSEGDYYFIWGSIVAEFRTDYEIIIDMLIENLTLPDDEYHEKHRLHLIKLGVIKG